MQSIIDYFLGTTYYDKKIRKYEYEYIDFKDKIRLVDEGHAKSVVCTISSQKHKYLIINKGYKLKNLYDINITHERDMAIGNSDAYNLYIVSLQQQY